MAELKFIRFEGDSSDRFGWTDQDMAIQSNTELKLEFDDKVINVGWTTKFYKDKSSRIFITHSLYEVIDLGLSLKDDIKHFLVKEYIAKAIVDSRPRHNRYLEEKKVDSRNGIADLEVMSIRMDQALAILDQKFPTG